MKIPTVTIAKKDPVVSIGQGTGPTETTTTTATEKLSPSVDEKETSTSSSSGKKSSHSSDDVESLPEETDVDPNNSSGKKSSAKGKESTEESSTSLDTGRVGGKGKKDSAETSSKDDEDSSKGKGGKSESKSVESSSSRDDGGSGGKGKNDSVKSSSKKSDTSSKKSKGSTSSKSKVSKSKNKFSQKGSKSKKGSESKKMMPSSSPTEGAAPSQAPVSPNCILVLVDEFILGYDIPGVSRMPTADELSRLTTATEAFYDEYFKAIYPSFAGIQLTAIASEFFENGSEKGDILVTFGGPLEFCDAANPPDENEILVSMAEANYGVYVVDYVKPLTGTAFENTETVHFIAEATVQAKHPYLAYEIPGLAMRPTDLQLAELQKNTEVFFDQYFRNFYLGTGTCEYIGLDMTIDFALFEAAIPDADYNLLAAFETLLNFSPCSTLPTPDDIFDTMSVADLMVSSKTLGI